MRTYNAGVDLNLGNRPTFISSVRKDYQSCRVEDQEEVEW